MAKGQTKVMWPSDNYEKVLTLKDHLWAAIIMFPSLPAWFLTLG